MKKISILILVLLLSFSIFSIELVQNGDSGLTARTKWNDNDTELDINKLSTVGTDSTINGIGTTSSPLIIANPFEISDSAKLDGIEDGAEVNTLNYIVAGTGVAIDVTDPLNPVISAGASSETDLYVNSVNSTDGAVTIKLSSLTDDRGVTIKNGQLSVGEWNNPQESVFGQGDSTTDTMIAYHTSDDLIFTDITDILSSDTGSSIGLFGGTTSGSTIYVGSDFIFSGVKAKINTDGIVEPDAVIAQFWDGGQWVGVNYMSTNSDFPYTQYGWELAQNGNISEQWRFNYDPYEINANWQKSNVNGVTKYWAKFRILTSITTDPIIEQIKLHTSRLEVNADGFTEYFGRARYKKTILSGVNSLINNSAQSPSNESVEYASGVTAGYLDNEFVSNANDSKLFVLNIDEGLDTSIPIEFKTSWYVKGTETGDVEFRLGKILVEDGFVYNGTAAVEGVVSKIVNVSVSSNLVRQTATIYIDINDAKPNTAYLMVFNRDSTSGNPNDTLNNNIILTHIVVNGYFWKP